MVGGYINHGVLRNHRPDDSGNSVNRSSDLASVGTSERGSLAGYARSGFVRGLYEEPINRI